MMTGADLLRLARSMAAQHGIDYTAVRRVHRMTWKWRVGESAWQTGSWGVSVRGTGFDATCSCGWESRTGGAVRAAVDRAVGDHIEEVVLDLVMAKKEVKA